jgi:hypothetical protein
MIYVGREIYLLYSMLQPAQKGRPIWRLYRMTASFSLVVKNEGFTADVFFYVSNFFGVPASQRLETRIDAA